MSESSGNSKVWMVIALVATAAAIWFALRSPEAPNPEVKETPTKTAEAKVAAPEAASPTAPPAAASPTWPEAPEVGDEPAAKEIEGNYIQDDKHALKLLDQTIEAAGGEKALQRWQQATWNRTSNESGTALPGSLLHLAGKMAVREEPQTGRTFGWRGGNCWVDRGEGLITECTLEDHAKMILAQAVHDATVLLPLRKGPYKVAKTSVYEHEGRTVNRYGFTLQGTDWSVTLLQEPDNLRPLRVTISRADRRIEPLHCDLGSYRQFDDLSVATMRAIHFQKRAEATDRPDDPPYTEVITAVSAGVDEAKMKPRKPAINSPIRVSARRALQVVAGPCANHAGLFEALIKTEERIPRAHNTLQPDWYEVLGEANDAAGLVAKLQVWVAPASAGGAVADAGFKRVAAQDRVARQVVKVPIAELPARYATFVAEVIKAGHKPKAGSPRLVHIVDVPSPPQDRAGDTPAPGPEAGPWTVEMQLPIEPK